MVTIINHPASVFTDTIMEKDERPMEYDRLQTLVTLHNLLQKDRAYATYGI